MNEPRIRNLRTALEVAAVALFFFLIAFWGVPS